MVLWLEYPWLLWIHSRAVRQAIISKHHLSQRVVERQIVDGSQQVCSDFSAAQDRVTVAILCAVADLVSIASSVGIVSKSNKGG